MQILENFKFVESYFFLLKNKLKKYTCLNQVKIDLTIHQWFFFKMNKASTTIEKIYINATCKNGGKAIKVSQRPFRYILCKKMWPRICMKVAEDLNYKLTKFPISRHNFYWVNQWFYSENFVLVIIFLGIIFFQWLFFLIGVFPMCSDLFYTFIGITLT